MWPTRFQWCYGNRRHLLTTTGRSATTLHRAKLLSAEIDVLGPAVTRDGKRPDNCEYPWADASDELRVPLDWTFTPSEMLVQHAGRTTLKLIVGAINRLHR